MEPLKAYDALSSYIEKQDAFIVRAIGTEAVAAALEMQATDITIALELSQEDFARYTSSLNEVQPAKHRADPTEAYLEAWQSYTYSVQEKFQSINGYGLGGVDEYGMTLVRSERLGERGSIVRLHAQIVDTELIITKVQQYIETDGPEPLPMRVGPLERLTVTMAFERLGKIVSEL